MYFKVTPFFWKKRFPPDGGRVLLKISTQNISLHTLRTKPPQTAKKGSAGGVAMVDLIGGVFIILSQI